MRDGIVKGMAIGAVLGMSAMAVFTSMNRSAQKKMSSAITGSAQKLADEVAKRAR